MRIFRIGRAAIVIALCTIAIAALSIFNRIYKVGVVILIALCFIAIAALSSPGSGTASAPLKVWSFYAPGCPPRHLPDSFGGEIPVTTLDPPPEIQGVYKFDDELGRWLFWAPGAPGCTLEYLVGGWFADYMVCTVGPCDWEFSQ